MKHKVLVIEDDNADMRVLKRVIGKADLEAVTAETLTRAKHIFAESEPESFLCAIVDYSLPDAPKGEAIDFAISAFLPVIAITPDFDLNIRRAILDREVVDYVPKENAQIFEYISRLLYRLEKNKEISVLIVHPSRSKRSSMASLLLRHNFNIFDVTDSETAESIVNTDNSVKLVICYERLNDVLGVELVASLRREHSKDELSIIGVTEHKSLASAARFIKSGASDYLQIPYSQEAFLCRVMQNVEHIEHIEAIKHAANMDYLTGLPNRRHFFERVQRKLKRKPKSMALALLDLDHFKSINDSMGHDTGDEVLRCIGELINLHFNEQIYARFGGEEFCVFFDNMTLYAALDQLEEFQKLVNRTTIVHGSHKVTCKLSIGLTSKYDSNIESMLKQADLYLYNAKENGRNRVVSDLDHPNTSQLA